MRGYTSTNKRFLSLTFYHVDAVGALHRHCLGKALFGSRCAATQHSLLDNGKGEKEKKSIWRARLHQPVLPLPILTTRFLSYFVFSHIHLYGANHSPIPLQRRASVAYVVT